MLIPYSPANRPQRKCFIWLVHGRLDFPVPFVPLCLLCTVPVLSSQRWRWCRPILVGGTQRHLLNCCVDSLVPFVPLCLLCTLPVLSP